MIYPATDYAAFEDDDPYETELLRQSILRTDFTPEQMAIVYLRIAIGITDIEEIADEMGIPITEAREQDYIAKLKIALTRDMIELERYGPSVGTTIH